MAERNNFGAVMSAFSRLTPASRAILLMISVILVFTLMDATAKALSGRIGVLSTLWARYIGQALVVTALILPRARSVLRTRYPWLQTARSVFLMCATGCFFLGISNIDLAEATAIMGVNPVLITLGAAVFLSEKLGAHRMVAICISLIRALIVIRPTSDVFSPYAVFPLLAAVFFIGYALASRFVGKDEDTWTSLFYTALFGAVLLSMFIPASMEMPDPTSLALIGGLAIFGTVSQLLLIRALMQGEAGMLAPFAYVGLIFATLWGMIFFDEFPDLWTILGALVIALSGIYVWHRETFANAKAENLD